eukprot:9501951-Pyramimonas_sp.AAC.1
MTREIGAGKKQQHYYQCQRQYAGDVYSDFRPASYTPSCQLPKTPHSLDKPVLARESTPRLEQLYRDGDLCVTARVTLGSLCPRAVCALLIGKTRIRSV